MKIDLKQLEEKINKLNKNRISFSEFLEDKMDEYDYSNTTLAKKVVHQVTDKETGEIRYVPVTRQAIAAWLKGTIPASREVYVSLGMAFHMSLREINKELLEIYMGTGLYCKNIDDAIWIAVIHRLFSFDELEEVRKEIEGILAVDSSEERDTYRSPLTTDLWEDLEAASTKEEFLNIIRSCKEEFRVGARKFGECLSQVIEEEYGYFEKNTEFLADIGCLHCEAQFSKIKAGKALVTREWLLRFLLSMQPSYESIEKLLAKAQMEPLGITPVEIVIDAVARQKEGQMSTSQEIWLAIEGLCKELEAMGFEMDSELSRKYDSIYSLPWKQKCFFAAILGKKMMECQAKKDYGYIQDEYCRYQHTDKILFEEMNRFKKNGQLKSFANHFEEKSRKEVEKVLSDADIEVLRPNQMEKDEYHLERFSEYCYTAFPLKKSNDYYMNDIYYYSALLYSIFTGRCFVKDFDSDKEREVKKYVDLEEPAKWLTELFYRNLGEQIVPEDMITIKEIVIKLLDMM